MLSMPAGWHKKKTRSVLLCAHVTRGCPVSSQFKRDKLHDRKVIEMRVFVAGGTGVIGRRLVPQLVAQGHQVTATTTDPGKMAGLEQLGAQAVVMDGLDAASVGEAVAEAAPDAIVHQMTAISVAHSGKIDLKHMDRWFATPNRLRTEGTDHLLAAAEATGVSYVVAQSYASWNGIREGGWVKTEEDPLDLHEGTAAYPGMKAIRHVEDAVLRVDGAVLRYGGLYGPGATDDQVDLVRKRQFPLVGWHRLLLVGAPRRRGERDGARPGAEGAGRLQHRRRRAGAGQRVAALPGSGCRCEAADARAHLVGPDPCRKGGSHGDDRRTRLLQREGQARARLGAALPVVASGFQGRTRTAAGADHIGKCRLNDQSPKWQVLDSNQSGGFLTSGDTAQTADD